MNNGKSKCMADQMVKLVLKKRIQVLSSKILVLGLNHSRFVGALIM